MRTHRFSLIELLTVMAIVAVMLAVATPALTRAVTDAQLDSAARSISRVVMLARQEAICKRRRVAVIFPAAGNLVATCYLDKQTGDFAGWTPNQAVVWLPSIGVVEGLYAETGANPRPVASSHVPAIAWSTTPPHEADCPAIIFRGAGSVDSADGMAPLVVRIIDAARTEGGGLVVRSPRAYTFEVNCFTGRGKFLDQAP